MPGSSNIRFFKAMKKLLTVALLGSSIIRFLKAMKKLLTVALFGYAVLGGVLLLAGWMTYLLVPK